MRRFHRQLHRLRAQDRSAAWRQRSDYCRHSGRAAGGRPVTRPAGRRHRETAGEESARRAVVSLPRAYSRRLGLRFCNDVKYGTFYVNRPLDKRFLPGYTLNEADWKDLLFQVDRRDKWIEKYQQMELDKSRELQQ